jgi:formylmethanofuran dehydrogenase subunit E
MQIPDNYDRFEQYEAEQEREASVYPVCTCCGETIFDDFLYTIDGEILCTDCLNDQYRHYTEDFMRGEEDV